uniref:Uncharacterized protein n=1 Tax=Oryza punctata TaxID=4537 RepID=A0A0E0MCT8_ORYPU
MRRPVLSFFHFSNSWKSARNKPTPNHQANAIQPHKKAFQMIQLTSQSSHTSAQGLSFGISDNYKSRTMKKMAQKT